jgi:hypothetical protein
MAKSKTDSSRKGKQLNFKQTNKIKTTKQQNMGNDKSVYRKPTWNSTDTFEISGIEFQELAASANMYRPLVSLVDRLLLDSELKGKIVNEYVYEDGTSADQTSDMVQAARKEREAYIEKTKAMVEEYESTLRRQAEQLEEQMKTINELTVNNEIENPTISISTDEPSSQNADSTV